MNSSYIYHQISDNVSCMHKQRRKYIFVRVKISNNFTCTSLEKNKSSVALYAAKNLAATSISQAKNGVLRVCYVAYAI
jgi:hypothetical protein